MTNLILLNIMTSLTTQLLRYSLTLCFAMILVGVTVGGVDCPTQGLLSGIIVPTVLDHWPAALPHRLIDNLRLHLNEASLDIGLTAHILMVRLELGHMRGVTLSLAPNINKYVIIIVIPT